MKKTLTALALIALLPAGAALAGADDREAAVPPVRAHHLDENARPLHRAAPGAARHGHKDRTHGHRHDKAGQHDDHRNHRRDETGQTRPAPAGNVAPPANGLFGTGAAPKVIVN